jgi:hypothetical protein
MGVTHIMGAKGKVSPVHQMMTVPEARDARFANWRACYPSPSYLQFMHISPSEFLRELPKTWEKSKGGNGRQMLASALFGGLWGSAQHDTGDHPGQVHDVCQESA